MPQGDMVLISLSCDHGFTMAFPLLLHTAVLCFSPAENPHFYNKAVIEEPSTTLTLESI